jgi:hypothetical protein
MLIIPLAAIALLVVVSQANATHPRPKGAWPLRASLVPAYNACTAPDRTHGPPLAFPSCSAPQQSNTRLTVGNPPAAAANMVGSWWISVQVGTPGPPDDTGLPMVTSVTDVRCQSTGAGCTGAGADYTGELELRLASRYTDHWNAVAPGGGSDTATVQDFDLSFPLACAATADPAIGSHCTANADLAFFYPGIAKDTKRVVWEIGQVQVLDGGADGETSTDDGAETFLRQGVFIP